MKLTKERVICLSLLGLGLGALALDRLVLQEGLTGPASANAASSALPDAPRAAATPERALTAAAAAGSKGFDIAAALAEAAKGLPAAPTRDAFRPPLPPAPPAVASPPTGGEASENEGAPPPRAADPIDELLGAIRITSVLDGGTARGAIIEGRFVRVGEDIGLRLLGAAEPAKRELGERLRGAVLKDVRLPVLVLEGPGWTREIRVSPDHGPGRPSGSGAAGAKTPGR